MTRWRGVCRGGTREEFWGELFVEAGKGEVGRLGSVGGLGFIWGVEKGIRGIKKEEMVMVEKGGERMWRSSVPDST